MADGIPNSRQRNLHVRVVWDAADELRMGRRDLFSVCLGTALTKVVIAAMLLWVDYRASIRLYRMSNCLCCIKVFCCCNFQHLILWHAYKHTDEHKDLKARSGAARVPCHPPWEES